MTLQSTSAKHSARRLFFPLFTVLATAATGQVSNDQSPTKAPAASSDETVRMEAFTVSSATRTERAIDYVPGAVMAIPSVDLTNIQAISLDPDEMLAQSIPGYTASMDDLTTSGELLRGKRPQFFVDGVLMSTPLRDLGRMASGMTDPVLVDRIEVVNGASAIEGLGGAGGIINYVTKVPKHEGIFTTFQTAFEGQEYGYKVGWKETVMSMIKRDNFDFLAALGTQDRPMYYDAKGHLEYINSNGSYQDSQTHSITAKAGYNFGANNEQRIQAAFSNYDIFGNNNYNSIQPGNRALGIVQSAVRGPGFGRPSENQMRIWMGNYINPAVFGGTFRTDVYWVQEVIIVGGASIDPGKQDPSFAPIGTLVDESDVWDRKYGAKIYWVKQDFIVRGLQFNLGYDYTDDRSYQNLILTGRTWIPTLHYTSGSGYTQLEYDRGPLTLSAGIRVQPGKITAPTFHTLYATNPALGGVTVTGGEKTYTAKPHNFGAVYRFLPGWSVFAGFSQGYELPDVGLVLRNTSKPNQSLASSPVSPVVTNSYEAGVNWHGKTTTFGIDAYYDHAPSATTVFTDPSTLLQSVMQNPIIRKGIEFQGVWKVDRDLKLSGTYSKMLAYTSQTPGGPTTLTIVPASTLGQDPDKAVLRADWTPASQWAIDLVGTNFWRQYFNVGKGTFFWKESGYALFDGSISFKMKRWGTLSFGCANILNKFHIETETGTSNTNYYSIQGRKYTLTHTITF